MSFVLDASTALSWQFERDAPGEQSRSPRIDERRRTGLELAMRMAVPLASFDQKLSKIAKSLGVETL